jgi:hypothetical protein
MTDSGQQIQYIYIQTITKMRKWGELQIVDVTKFIEY